MHMLMFVLDDPMHLDNVLDALESAGVSGVTIIESTGMARHRVSKMVGSPLMAGLNRWMHSDQEGHYTLFTIVKGEEVVRKCIQAVETVVGDLSNPDSGVMAAWPVSIVKGVPDPSLNTEDSE